MYFRKFPNVYYTFEGTGGEIVTRIMKDITVNTAVREEVLSRMTSYDVYNVEDEETPESLAYKLYGDPQYHWVVMLCNNIRDYRTEWPMPTRALSRYINDKYNLYEGVKWVADGKDKILITIEGRNDLLSVGDEVEISILPQGVLTGVISSISVDGDDTMVQIIPDEIPPAGSNISFRTFLKEEKVKHFEDRNGFIVDPEINHGMHLTPVTYLEFEERENDRKRAIRVISPSLINRFVTQLEEII